MKVGYDKCQLFMRDFRSISPLNSKPWSNILVLTCFCIGLYEIGAIMVPRLLQSNILIQYADLLYRILSVKLSEMLPRDALETLRRKRFETLLYHVFRHSEFYNALYRSKGITPEDIPDLKLVDLPLIDKNIMMQEYDRFVCDKALSQHHLEAFISNPDNRGKKYQGRFQVIHTSGSTGHIGLFAYDMRSWNITKAMAITRVSKARLNPLHKIKLAFIGATDGHYAGISLSSDAPKLFYDFRRYSVNRPMHEILEEIGSFKPIALCGYASGIYLLACEQLQDKLGIAPETVICSADQLTDSMRSNIIKAFGLDPVNFYAASESLCLAAECERHQGLHLFEDWHYYEVVNSNNRPVNPGDSGSLILTTLHNFAQPLIRYQMHDDIVLDTATCDCGRSTTLIKRISGRSEDFLWFALPDGNEEFLHPLQIVEFFVPGLEKFQLEQPRKNHLHMRMIVKGDERIVQEKALHRMQEILSDKALQNVVTFSTEIVEHIKQDAKTGKFKLIVPFKNEP